MSVLNKHNHPLDKEKHRDEKLRQGDQIKIKSETHNGVMETIAYIIAEPYANLL